MYVLYIANFDFDDLTVAALAALAPPIRNILQIPSDMALHTKFLTIIFSITCMVQASYFETVHDV